MMYCHQSVESSFKVKVMGRVVVGSGAHGWGGGNIHKTINKLYTIIIIIIIPSSFATKLI